MFCFRDLFNHDVSQYVHFMPIHTLVRIAVTIGNIIVTIHVEIERYSIFIKLYIAEVHQVI
jgi:hypothetical protein